MSDDKVTVGGERGDCTREDDDAICQGRVVMREFFTFDDEDRRVFLLSFGVFAYVWGYNASNLWLTFGAYVVGAILLRRFIRRM